MKTLTAAVMLCLLSGCATAVEFAAGQMPSLKYCQTVGWMRNGDDVDIVAKCRLPPR
jgi:uncharacterized protein YceK